jgi:hypothetical protein
MGRFSSVVDKITRDSRFTALEISTLFNDEELLEILKIKQKLLAGTAKSDVITKLVRYTLGI